MPPQRLLALHQFFYLFRGDHLNSTDYFYNVKIIILSQFRINYFLDQLGFKTSLEGEQE